MRKFSILYIGAFYVALIMTSCNGRTHFFEGIGWYDDQDENVKWMVRNLNIPKEKIRYVPSNGPMTLENGIATHYVLGTRLESAYEVLCSSDNFAICRIKNIEWDKTQVKAIQKTDKGIMTINMDTGLAEFYTETQQNNSNAEPSGDGSAYR